MKTRSNRHQVSGNHYEIFKIEVVHLCAQYQWNWFQGECLKYISRFPYKGGYKDLQKAIHIMDMAIDLKVYVEESITFDHLLDDYIAQFQEGYFIEPLSFRYFKEAIVGLNMGNYAYVKEQLKLLIYTEYETLHFEE